MSERIWMWIAWRLPRTLVMWCAVRIGANATQGEYSSQVVPDLSFMDAMQRWDQPSHWCGTGRAGNGSDM